MTSRTNYTVLSCILAATIGLAVGGTAGKISRAWVDSSESANQMEGYYDPVNKVMCYWLKDSKATPACLIVDWPYEVEGTGDEEYSRNKEEAENATYRY